MWARLTPGAWILALLACSSPAATTTTDAGGGADRATSPDVSTAVDAASGSDVVAADAAPTDAGSARACKRGIASNTPPSAALFPGVGWWYNWSNRTTAADVGVAFVPMIWDERTVSAAIPAGAAAVLGFNEPNFMAQANLTAQQAATYWRMVEANAGAAGLPLVSPAVNFCGPDANCNGTNPYQYLKDFFAACAGCRVDAVAVHWYNCDLPSLRDYLEPGGSLEGFEQFGKPIWLTEFACAIGGDTSPAGQEAYMRQAIPYLESNPHVARYAWFSADPIPEARLMNADGSLTALGGVYVGLDQGCH